MLKRGSTILLASALGLTLVLSHSAIAGAAPQDQEQVAQQIEQALDAMSLKGTAVAHPDESEAAVPQRSDQPVVFEAAGGLPVSIGLPPEVNTSEGAITRDNTVVYEGVDDSADLAVQALDDGVRIITVVADSEQSDSYSYELGDNLIPTLEEDGTVSLAISEVIDDGSGGEVELFAEVGHFEIAWAVDAEGNAVETHYEIEGNAVVQKILWDENTVFPVVADPHYVGGLTNLTWYIRWNRAETASIATSGWTGAALTVVCIRAGTVLATPAGGAVLGAACAGMTAIAVYTAGVAYNSSPRRCLQMAFNNLVLTPAFPNPRFGTYACS